MEKNIGVISDTHGLLRHEVVGAFKGVDLIIHAGDMGSLEVIEKLYKIAPVVAVRGNCDKGSWSQEFNKEELVKIQNCFVYVLHNINESNIDVIKNKIDVVIFGHSHKPLKKRKHGVLFLNPGSAGPRRFKLPVTTALLRITQHSVDAEIVHILKTNGHNNC